MKALLIAAVVTVGTLLAPSPVECRNCLATQCYTHAQCGTFCFCHKGQWDVYGVCVGR